MAGEKKRVLILGAGAAGIVTALELNKASTGMPGLEVTLVDQRNYHHPLPFIWQVVSGSVEPSHISFPLHSLLKRKGAEGAVRFRQSRVEGIDVEKKVVNTGAGKIRWEYLVIALGSTTNFFGMSDVEKNSLSFKSLRDAVNIHNRILDNYKAALLERNEERQHELLAFTVVGGGPTGIELAAAIQDFVSKALVRDYPSLMPQTRVLLVEAQDALLSGLGAKVSDLAISRLRSRGVEVLLKTRITKVLSNGVQTADGQSISTRTVIWVAGVKPVDVVESLPFEKAKDGRIVVNQYMEVPESPGVYVLGDCAYLLQENGSVPYPPTQQVAGRQGPVCARNIIRAMRGEDQLSFRYRFKGQVVYMGRNLVLAQLGNRVFDGFAAALLRRFYYLWVFISYLGLRTELRRKLGAVRSWIPAYFYRRNTAHLE
ncbi:MAG: NAD(P)/FAD-dependent oxidoreductase [Chloroflexota bacterium]